jgi:phage baseplate assembly protein W
VSEEFIGRGWSFPLRVNQRGGIALVSREREIEESIRIILATAPGERPMRPEFGCGIHDYVFAPADALTAGNIAFQVMNALEAWEPRIDVVDVRVDTDVDDRGVLYINLMYSVSGSNDVRNLVFPFYVIPSEEAP